MPPYNYTNSTSSPSEPGIDFCNSTEHSVDLDITGVGVTIAFMVQPLVAAVLGFLLVAVDRRRWSKRGISNAHQLLKFEYKSKYIEKLLSRLTEGQTIIGMVQTISVFLANKNLMYSQTRFIFLLHYISSFQIGNTVMLLPHRHILAAFHLLYLLLIVGLAVFTWVAHTACFMASSENDQHWGTGFASAAISTGLLAVCVRHLCRKKINDKTTPHMHEPWMIRGWAGIFFVPYIFTAINYVFAMYSVDVYWKSHGQSIKGELEYGKTNFGQILAIFGCSTVVFEFGKALYAYKKQLRNSFAASSTEPQDKLEETVDEESSIAKPIPAVMFDSFNFDLTPLQD